MAGSLLSRHAAEDISRHAGRVERHDAREQDVPFVEGLRRLALEDRVGIGEDVSEREAPPGRDCRHRVEAVRPAAYRLEEAPMQVVEARPLLCEVQETERDLRPVGRVNRGRRGPLRDVFVHSVIPDASAHIYSRRPVEQALATLRPYAGDPIQEDLIQNWVDASYEAIAEAFVEDVMRRTREYRRAVIETNRPLESHENLKELFDQQFDGTEVVPLSLRGEYERRLEEEPLTA
jgi:hypothetical protein